MELKLYSMILCYVCILTASATLEYVSVGSYNISFDLENVISDYSIEILAENETNERYDGSTYIQNAVSIRGQGFFNDSTTDYSLIIINRDETPWYVDSDSIISDIESMIDRFGYYDVETYSRSIDGYDTFLGVGNSPWKQTLYYTIYYPNCCQDGDYCIGNTKVAILSLQSWDLVAPLLRTIHVELPDIEEIDEEILSPTNDPNSTAVLS